MKLSDEQLTSTKKDAIQIVKEFTDSGLTFELAKKAAIKVLRLNIKELLLIDEIYLVGLAPRINILRQEILFIIEM